MTGWLAAAGLAVIALAAMWFGGKNAGRNVTKAETKLLTAKEALAQERERIARDEQINGAADLNALARNAGLVRPDDGAK